MGSSFGLSLSEIQCRLGRNFCSDGVLFCVGEKESLRLFSHFLSNEDLDDSVAV